MQSTEDSKLPLTCREAFVMLGFSKKSQKDLADLAQKRFVDFLLEKKNGDIYLMKSHVVAVLKKSTGHVMLLFDSRHLPSTRTSAPLVCLVFDSAGRVLKQTDQVSQLPRLGNDNFKRCHPRQPLWKLLKLSAEPTGPPPPDDPTNRKEAVALLGKYGKLDFCNLHCAPRSYRKFRAEMWNVAEGREQIHVEAFTTRDYSIGFRERKCKIDTYKNPLPAPAFMKKEHEEPKAAAADWFAKNKSSAVSVKLAGLNQALNLGLISEQEFSDMSRELGKWIGALWIELCGGEEEEDKIKVRYLAYQDANRDCTFKPDDWQSVFDYIFARREMASINKSRILRPLLDKLDVYPTKNCNSLWKQCLLSITRYINNFKILLQNEEALHAIKVPFAHYVREKKTKNFRGVGMQASATNELVALITAQVTLFSMSGFVPMEKPPVLEMKKQGGQLRELAKRGKILAKSMHLQWREFGANWMNLFSLDIHCEARYQNLSNLSFTGVWLAYTRRAGPMHHGLEKTKGAYEEMLRHHSHGGFTFSCEAKLDAGQPLFGGGGGEPARTILELDFISSYPAACSNMQVATGFAVGYQKTGNNLLVRCDPVARHRTFEFKSVYYTLFKLLNESSSSSSPIRSVYSNFHQLGVFYVGKFPLDLVVVYSDGRMQMYNFDGNFAHGCPSCPALSMSYTGFQTREQVEKKTTDRDAFLRQWISGLAHISYTVLTDCHDADYTQWALDHAFGTVPELIELVKGIPGANSMTIQEVLDIDPAANLTYLAVVSGHCSATTKPLLLAPSAGGGSKLLDRNWRRSNEAREVLLTRQFLEYLMRDHQFEVTDVSCIIFYKTCTVLSDIYKQLVRQRTTALPARRDLLKKVGNFSCGYFGLNAVKYAVSWKYTLVAERPHKYDPFTCEMMPVGKVGRQTYYFLKKRKRQRNFNRQCQSALPLFVSVVEYGKLRMSQALCFLDKVLRPSSFSHLYSNVDNLILALSGPLLDDCVAAERFDEYLREKQQYFEFGEPGHLKLEWKMSSPDWRFVSGMTQNYALVSETASRHKNSALNGITSMEGYEAACSLLEKRRVCFEQERRTNKLANLNTVVKTFVFNK
jgi:hypothetical protein